MVSPFVWRLLDTVFRNLLLSVEPTSYHVLQKTFLLASTTRGQYCITQLYPAFEMTFIGRQDSGSAKGTCCTFPALLGQWSSVSAFSNQVIFLFCINRKGIFPLESMFFWRHFLQLSRDYAKHFFSSPPRNQVCLVTTGTDVAGKEK